MIVAEVDGYACIDNRSTAARLVVKKHAIIYPQYRGLTGRSLLMHRYPQYSGPTGCKEVRNIYPHYRGVTG